MYRRWEGMVTPFGVGLGVGERVTARRKNASVQGAAWQGSAGALVCPRPWPYLGVGRAFRTKHVHGLVGVCGNGLPQEVAADHDARSAWGGVKQEGKGGKREKQAELCCLPPRGEPQQGLRPTFSCFAVDGSDVLGVCREPVVQVAAKAKHDLNGRWIVVIKGKDYT